MAITEKSRLTKNKIMTKKPDEVFDDYLSNGNNDTLSFIQFLRKEKWLMTKTEESEQPEASEDELWNEIEKEIINWENEDDASLADFIDFLKSKFEIRRKQQ